MLVMGLDYLILDEPFSMLDGDTQKELAGFIRRTAAEAGTNIVLISRSAEEVAGCDTVLVLDQGRALYAGGLPAFLLVLRDADAAASAWGGTAVVFFPLAVVWACDTAAMAAGFGIGGPKLAPVLSPKKTWAGAIGGTLAAAVIAPLWGRFVLLPFGIEIGPGLLVAFGLIVAVVGQSGDIAESLLKRQVGVKDSGGFFPGHGGVLDRLDSLYWVLPVTVGVLALAGVL